MWEVAGHGGAFAGRPTEGKAERMSAAHRFCEVDELLSQSSAKRLIVGHTPQDKVTPYCDGKVGTASKSVTY